MLRSTQRNLELTLVPSACQRRVPKRVLRRVARHGRRCLTTQFDHEAVRRCPFVYRPSVEVRYETELSPILAVLTCSVEERSSALLLLTNHIANHNQELELADKLRVSTERWLDLWSLHAAEVRNELMRPLTHLFRCELTSSTPAVVEHFRYCIVKCFLVSAFSLQVRRSACSVSLLLEPVSVLPIRDISSLFSRQTTSTSPRQLDSSPALSLVQHHHTVRPQSSFCRTSLNFLRHNGPSR